jgi:acid phosphatase type 7
MSGAEGHMAAYLLNAVLLMLTSLSARRRNPVLTLNHLLCPFFVAAAACAAPLTKGPYLQAPGARSMTVMWETLSDEPGLLRLGEGAAPEREIGPIKPTLVQSGTNSFYVYEARLDQLKASTAYTYEVVVGADRSGRRRFTTFGTAPERVTFIAYGDSRSNPAKHTALAAQFRRYSPDFIIHSGDLVLRGTQYELWSREFFEPLARVIDEVPILPSIGNHEQNGANYLTYFHQPGDHHFYYSCDIGPVHILALDYRSTSATDEQFKFVKEDLANSHAPWKVVLLHYPMFNLGGHRTFWGHENYLPLFRAMQVDVVFAGHSHLYERFRPLVPKSQPGAWAIQHITTGGGGASLAASVPDPSLASTAKAYHFVVATVTRDQLDARCIDVDGRQIDAFTLRKENGHQSADYLAQAYPEEDVAAAGKALLTKAKAPTPAPTNSVPEPAGRP